VRLTHTGFLAVCVCRASLGDGSAERDGCVPASMNFRKFVNQIENDCQGHADEEEGHGHYKQEDLVLSPFWFFGVFTHT
jgi:hypothetical protein